MTEEKKINSKPYKVSAYGQKPREEDKMKNYGLPESKKPGLDLKNPAYGLDKSNLYGMQREKPGGIEKYLGMPENQSYMILIGPQYTVIMPIYGLEKLTADNYGPLGKMPQQAYGQMGKASSPYARQTGSAGYGGLERKAA